MKGLDLGPPLLQDLLIRRHVIALQVGPEAEEHIFNFFCNFFVYFFWTSSSVAV